MQSPMAIARREKYRLRVKIGGNVARLDVSEAKCAPLERMRRGLYSRIVALKNVFD